MCLRSSPRLLRDRSFSSPISRRQSSMICSQSNMEEEKRGRGGGGGGKGRKKRKEKERDRKGEKQRRRGKALNGTINICRCNVKSATKCRGSVNVKYTRVYRIIRGADRAGSDGVHARRAKATRERGATRDASYINHGRDVETAF